ncbi:MAG: DUF1631 domain-containing protein [Pseudomonadales bacterium]
MAKPETCMQKPSNKIVPLTTDVSRATLCKENHAVAASSDANPVQRLQDSARQQLSQLLQSMFDSADDALFALADKAQTNSEQNVYFESMRDVRLKRRSIEASFSQSVPQAFRALHSSSDAAVDASDGASVKEASPATLSLVQNDELEERVAIDGIVARILNTETDALREITQRLDSLVSEATVDENNCPLGPRSICVGFMQACQCLEVDIKSKLVVYKLFEKELVSSLGKVHKQCNQLLIDLGVLPGLTAANCGKSGASSSRREPSATALSNAAAFGESLLNEASNDDNLNANEVFLGMQRLMAERQSYVMSHSALPSANWFAPGQAPELPRQQLFDLLTQAQTQSIAYEQSAAGAGVGLRTNLSQPTFGQVLDVHDTMRALLAAQDVKEKRSIPQLDFDAINLVSMLFQFILDDENLAPEMKAHIARLQIPVLKAAMLDESFFGTDGHPARQLLNKIATAAIGWETKEGSDEDPLLAKVHTIVDTLLQEFDQDTHIFSKKLQEFELFLQQESKRAALLEKRAVDAADGKARAERAREHVQKALDARLSLRKIPAVVEQLLREAWSNVMFLAFVREGEDSTAWRAAIETAEQLIWSVCEEAEERSRSELLEMMPSMLRSLREGLTQVSFDSFKMNSLFSDLEKIHLGMLSSSNVKPSTNDLPNEREGVDLVKDDTAQVSAKSNAASNKKVLESDVTDKVSRELRDGERLSVAATDNLDQMMNDVDLLFSTADDAINPASLGGELNNDQEQDQDEEVSAVLTKPEGNASEISACVPSSETIESSDDNPVVSSHESLRSSDFEQLNVGSWVEGFDENDVRFRAKLAAVTRPNEMHIFVNRAGLKKLELTRVELNERIASHKIKILDNGALFDRALQSVIGSLREYKKPEFH